ncbi:MAG: AsmA-like C-terminal region-containing protein [Saprospiraceae bacterium]|nr:AsmA-like C-terminal region-containing protein [Saprospiraceae bacterium]
MIKKVLKITGLLLLALLIAVLAIPYFFKDRIVETVKTEINKNINAKVEFTDVNLSLVKSFPDFNFTLDQLSVTGIDEFENDTLIEAETIELSLDLMSVLSSGKPLEINTISLQKPFINIKILRDGKANYDIVKSTDTPAEDAASENEKIQVQLQAYTITEGKFIYDDRLGATYLEMVDLDHNGNGAFTQDVFDFSTTTDIGSITAKSGGITYLNKAKGDIDLNILADIPNSKYTIKENAIGINALQLNMEGFIQLVGDKIDMDIVYSAPNNNFKSLLSMIPSAYTKDFKEVQANGKLSLNGFVKGNYDAISESLPAFLLNLKVENGNFKYPNLPLGIEKINSTIQINSPSSNLDKMVVDISNFNMELGNNPFEAKIKLWTLLSDPNIDSQLQGTIDLAELAKAFPMEGVSQLNGIITSNLSASTSMSAIDAQDYENIDMTGDVSIENLDYHSEGNPQVQVSQMKMNFSPQYVKLDKFEAQFGKSDIKAEGTIDNILAYFAPEKTMTGQLNIRSNFIDANEWAPGEETNTNQPDLSVSESASEAEVFDRYDFTIDAQAKKIVYTEYELIDSKMVGQVTPTKATLRTLETNIGESDFKMDGEFTNINNYIFENETLKGDINLTSNYINANEFMLEEGAVAEEEIEVFPVPEKMDLNINTQIGEVLYTTIPLQNIKGNIKVSDEIATIENGNAKTLGGDVVMNGSYNTQNIEAPKFDMDYKVSSLNYQDAFNQLNTFQALAPIGKFIEGELNTDFNMSGNLGQDMLPILNSLSASGILETMNGTLKNFKPLEELANKLNLNSLKSIDLKNTKNWFELNDGEVKIKDFDYSTNGIDMVIGGSHSLDNEMAYHIKAKIPRTLLKNNAVGQAADKGLGFLQDQASKLGVNIDEAEFVNVDVLITGTMTNPVIKLNLLGADGQLPSIDDIKDKITETAIDKASDVIKDKTGVDVKNIDEEIKEVKEDLSAKAEEEIAALMKKTKSNIDEIIKEAENRAQQTQAEAKKLSEKTKVEGYKQADELVEKAGSNIFKKKAAEITAKKLKETTDEKALQIITKGDEVAKGILDTAKKQTDKIQAAADAQAEEIRKKY